MYHIAKRTVKLSVILCAVILPLKFWKKKIDPKPIVFDNFLLFADKRIDNYDIDMPYQTLL